MWRLHLLYQVNHITFYHMDDIERDLGLSRQHLVAYGILSGCDYYEGVKGIGQEFSLRLFKELQGEDILERYKTRFIFQLIWKVLLIGKTHS